MLENNWFTERAFRQTVAQSYKVKRVLHEEESAWQKIAVLETESIGRLLLLDGKTMVSDHDEFVYHEIMGHVSSMSCPQVENVLIIGGGDCGIVREFVKYPNIKSIELVEIDERVIEVSKEYFPNCTSGMTDPRVKVVPTDGIEYIKKFSNKYDIVIVDSTDPEGFALGLFSENFYKTVFNALTPHGVMMNQAENTFYDEFNIKDVFKALRNIFPIVSALTAPMCIYPGVHWTFGFASKQCRPTLLDEQKVDFMQRLQQNLKWYNMDWHRGAFQLSNFDKRALGLE